MLITNSPGVSIAGTVSVLPTPGIAPPVFLRNLGAGTGLLPPPPGTGAPPIDPISALAIPAARANLSYSAVRPETAPL